MRALLLATLLLFAASVAHAEPWIVTGQTNIPAGTGIDNPQLSNPGAVGQVTALAYTVPDGCTLTIYAYGMEGYNKGPGVSVLFLWTGVLPANPALHSQWRIDHGAASVAAGTGSQEITGQRLTFPEGTVINVRLINGTAYGAVFGWYVSGQIYCS